MRVPLADSLDAALSFSPPLSVLVSLSLFHFLTLIKICFISTKNAPSILNGKTHALFCIVFMCLSTSQPVFVCVCGCVCVLLIHVWITKCIVSNWFQNFTNNCLYTNISPWMKSKAFVCKIFPYFFFHFLYTFCSLACDIKWMCPPAPVS